MATAVKPVVSDPQSRFLEMRSLQPYSTTDEYLYAMKEDLADWLSTMYPDWRPITADNFLECLGESLASSACFSFIIEQHRQRSSLIIPACCFIDSASTT